MNQAILEQVLKSPRLPSLPAIAIEVIDLVQQKDVNIKQIAHTISHDPALSSKILKTVNSSFYGQAHSISTISHALVILGLNSVKTLALGFSLVPNIKDAGGESFDHVLFWKRSLYSAVAARSLAKQFGVIQQEEAFLGGLLQDLGLLAMNQTLGEDYQELLSSVGTEHRGLIARERELLKTDHAEVGAALAETWHLPPLLVEPIRYHEDITSAPAELEGLIRCVALGARVADIFVCAKPDEALSTFQQLALDWYRMAPDVAEGLLEGIHKNTVEMKRLFDLPTGDLENPDQIMARANEALTMLSLQQERQTSELKQQNQELVQQAFTDSLTGAANRRRFNDFISAEFEAAGLGNTPLTVLFLDADKFKSFNDTYGHQVGDRVLIELASVLKRNAPKGALVARYGGEEFAVVLPSTARLDGARLADRIRRDIASHPIPGDNGQTLHITASIGVASFEGTVFARAEQLIKAADQAVYAAKSSGRNCVRIFVPRAPAKPAAATPKQPAA